MRSHTVLQFAVSSFFGILSLGALGQNVAAVASGPSPAGKSDSGAVTTVVPPASTSQFILGAADVIRVNVWKNNDLSQTVTVGPDGFVSLPLLGDVHVTGLTANE